MHFVFVHGTVFRREEEWSEAWTPLRDTLLAAFPGTRYSSFSWSGFNGYGARKKAGEELVELILGVAKLAPVVLVAHSHGGNVVRYALGDRRLRGIPIEVVFLGTPFLEMRGRNYKPALVLLAVAFAILFSFAGGLGASWLSDRFFDPPYSNGPYPVPARMEGDGEGVLAPAWIAWTIFGIWLAGFGYGKALRWLRHEARRVRARLGFRRLRTPHLIVTAQADEALWYLRALDGVSNVFATAITVLPFLLLGVGVLNVAIDNALGDRALLTATSLFGRFLQVTFVACLVVFPVASWILRGHMMGFGWEGLTGNVVTAIRPARALRETQERAGDVLPLPTPVRELSTNWRRKAWIHSIYYRQPSVAAAVASWLSTRR